MMLVKFDSKVGQFFMDGEVAVQLLKWMGHTGAIPGAIVAADIEASRARLEAAVKVAPPPEPKDDADGRREPVVSARQRAFPLLDLLARAARQHCDVLWDQL